MRDERSESARSAESPSGICALLASSRSLNSSTSCGGGAWGRPSRSADSRSYMRSLHLRKWNIVSATDHPLGFGLSPATKSRSTFRSDSRILRRSVMARRLVGSGGGLGRALLRLGRGLLGLRLLLDSGHGDDLAEFRDR